MTDCEWILSELRKGRGLTAWDCIRERGCTKLNSRISDLRRKGFEIKTEMVNGTNRRGEHVHYAVYRLEAEPDPEPKSA